MFGWGGQNEAEQTPGWGVVAKLDIASQTFCDITEGPFLDLSMIQPW